MNERIIELANKANETVGHTFRLEDAKQLHELMEKFAELIVRECMEVAHPKLTDVGEWAAGMRLVQKRLKHHFGVEE